MRIARKKGCDTPIQAKKTAKNARKHPPLSCIGRGSAFAALWRDGTGVAHDAKTEDDTR